MSSSELTEIGYPVFGANGYIGFYHKYNHINETIVVTCRGATCGEVTLVKAKSYITGNAMSIDEINEKEHSTLYIYYAGVVCGRGRNPTLRLWPAIFSGEIDVFPSERRNMGQEIGR
ncbi:restriction endonuclease subunit S [Acinetobacter baumannii]|uniref:restriction endonuclease subunit S n=1 Tax=Acinetobacter baumannii TaxID=470 RepID=UPI00391714CD